MKKLVLLSLAVLLSACGISEQTSVNHGYPIGVVRDQKGKSHAVVQPCPEWNQYMGDGFDNDAPKQFGCADSYNLAHMVVNPSDLVKGRKPGDAEASPGVLSIERYREGKTKELINPKDIGATDSGK